MSGQQSKFDAFWMARALAVSRRGLGHVNPNPLVGAIAVGRGGKKISQGFHAAYGQAHAEKIALDIAGSKAKGGTLYVTLEPCSHYGNTPPCVDAVIASGVKRVVIGSLDPNPKVSSIEMLQDAGIKVVTGVLKAGFTRLNRIYTTSLHQKSYVLAKVAISRDGFMGARNKRVLISDSKSQPHVMRLRAQVDGILVGKHTWQTDNPRLNVRGKYKDRKPTRIFLDTKLAFSEQAQALQSEGGPILLIHDERVSCVPSWMASRGIQTLALPTHKGQFSPTAILEALHKRHIRSILLEGGASLIESFDQEGLIDDWTFLYAKHALRRCELPNSALIPAPKLRFPPNLQSVIASGDDLIWSSF